METVESVLFDSRINRCKKHNLESIVLIVVLATVKRVYGYHKISEFAKQNAEILENFIDLSHGCPSTVTLWRNFERLNISRLIDYIELKKDVLQDLINIKLNEEPSHHKENHSSETNKSNLDIIKSHIDENYCSILDQHVDKNKPHNRDVLYDVIEKLTTKNEVLAVTSKYNSPDMANLIVQNEGEYLLEINSANHSFYEQLKDQLDKNIQTVGIQEKWHSLKYGTTIKMRRIFCLEQQMQWLDDIDQWPNAKCMIAIQEKNNNGEGIACSTKYYLCSKKYISQEQLNILSEYHFMKSFAWMISFKTDKHSDTHTTAQKILKNNLKWIQRENVSIST